MRKWSLKLKAALKIKIIKQLLLAPMETFTNCKDFSESRIRISVPASLCFHWSIFIQNACYTCNLLLENLSESQGLFKTLLESEAAT
jgi:hypothetical protein